MKLPETRKYRFKGTNTGKESARLWIMIVIGLAAAAIIIFWL